MIHLISAFDLAFGGIRIYVRPSGTPFVGERGCVCVLTVRSSCCPSSEGGERGAYVREGSLRPESVLSNVTAVDSRSILLHFHYG
jgi:hypothetical protein